MKRRTNSGPSPRAVRQYEKFHGKRPRRAFAGTFNDPKELIVLGRAVLIQYECDKVNGGGDGTKAYYEHKFAPGTILCMDETGKRQLYILGNRLYVSDRGIVN